jgi:Protein of unknown function (DUF4236)
MSFLKFRRRLRLFPGLWINLSKKGTSVSAGGRGFTVNSRGRTTLSLPGTGLSYVLTPQQRLAQEQTREEERHNPLPWIGLGVLAGLTSGGNRKNRGCGGCGCMTLVIVLLSIFGSTNRSCRSSTNATMTTSKEATSETTPTTQEKADNWKRIEDMRAGKVTPIPTPETAPKRTTVSTWTDQESDSYFKKSKTHSAKGTIPKLASTHEVKLKNAPQAKTHGPLVWVNTNTGVYHYPGTRRYGNTVSGRYISEEEAIAEGDRPAKNGQ